MKNLLGVLLLILSLNIYSADVTSEYKLKYNCPKGIKLWIWTLSDGFGLVQHNGRNLVANHYFIGLTEKWKIKDGSIEVKFDSNLYYFSGGVKETHTSGMCSKPKEEVIKTIKEDSQ